MKDDQPSSLPTDQWQAVHALIERFEEAWESGEFPSLSEYLPPDGDLRAAAIDALVRVDFERRSRAGAERSAEHYVAELPELLDAPQLLLLAISQEYQERRRTEPGLGIDEYLSRFPGHAEQIRAQWSDVTAEQATAAWESTGGPRPAARSPAPLPRIPGYEIIGLVASGGMGSVFKARDVKLGRLVAIKLPRQEYLADAEGLERFVREARAAAKLHHANVCPIHQIGEVDGRPFIAMTFVGGPTLRRLASQSDITARHAAEITAKLARAVGYAHKHGVIHRDIKPANVLMDAESGEPILTDFGLAKELADADANMTQTGQVLGTPAYMAPEQATADTARIGPQTDVYGLGAVLYHLLCSRPPFEGSTGEIYASLKIDDPPPPRQLAPQLHRDLEVICLKALHKEPRDRYDSADALADDLERFVAGEAILARPQGLLSRSWQRVLRRPLAIGVSLLLLAAVLGGLFAWSGYRSRRVAQLTSHVEQALADGDWSPERVRMLEATIDQLRGLDSALASQLDQRATAELASSIELQLGLRATDERTARIEAAIDVLQRRDAARAGPLRSRLLSRRRSWQDVGRLSAPFVSAADVFGDNVVRVTGAALATISDARVSPESVDLRVSRIRPTTVKYRRAPLVVTQLACQDDLELSASFDESWEDAHEIGLVLNAASSKRYEFILRVVQRRDKPGEQPALTTFRSARATEGAFLIEIWRSGSPLLRREVPPEYIPATPLRLRAQRVRGDLLFQVNSEDPIKFHDPFSIGPQDAGVFALRWSADVRLLSLSARSRGRAEEAGLFEAGDQLYDEQQFPEALEVFGRAADMPDPLSRQEAAYKQGLCLLALNQLRNAEERLNRLMGEPGDRWPLLAAIQLWAMHLEQGNDKKAKDVYEELQSRRLTFDQLAALVPHATREQILSSYMGNLATVAKATTYDEDRLNKVERGAAVDRLLSHDGKGTFAIQFELCRAYRYLSQYQQALEVATRLTRDFQNPSGRLQRYRMLRLLGRADEMLADVSAYLSTLPGDSEGRAMYLLERAKGHMARRDVDAALADVRRVLQFYSSKGVFDESPTYGSHAATACLMEGVLLARLGFQEEAVASWRKGFAISRGRLNNPSHAYNPNLVMTLAQGGLAGELTDEEAAGFVKAAAANSAPGSIVGRAIAVVGEQKIARANRAIWRTERGMDFAEGLVMETIGLSDKVRIPMMLQAHALHCQDAFSNLQAKQQDEHVWRLMGEGYRRVVLDDSLNLPQLIWLLRAWNGNTGLTGWQMVAPTLEDEFRAQIAWSLGHRLLRLGADKRTEAGKLFEEAARLAPDSVVARTAEADLSLLRQQRGRVLIASRYPQPVKVLVSRNGQQVAEVEVDQISAELPLPPGRYRIRLAGDNSELRLQSNAAVEAPSDEGLQIRVLLAGTSEVNVQWAWAPSGSPPLPGMLAHPAALPGVVRWQLCRVELMRSSPGIAWSGDGKWIACGWTDRTTRVYDAESLAPVQVLAGHALPNVRPMFNPDGSLLATIDNAGDVMVWDVGPWRLHARFQLGSRGSWQFCWHSDGRQLAFGDGRGKIDLWSADGVLLRSWQGHSRAVDSLDWSPDGSQLVSTSSRGKQCTVWDSSGIMLTQVGEDEDNYTGAAWIDDRQLVTASPSALRLWRPSSPSVDDGLGVVKQIEIPEAPQAARIQWHEGTKRLRVHIGRRRYYTWNPEDDVLLQAADADWLAPAPGPSGQAARVRNRQIQIFDADDQLVRETPRIAVPDIRAVQWSGDGERIAMAVGNQVAVVDSEGRLLRSIAAPTALLDVDWSPDGQKIAAAGSDGKVRIWSSSAGELLQTLESNVRRVDVVAWSLDGRLLASAGDGGAVQLWNEDGSAGPALDAAEQPIRALAWSADDRLAAGDVRGNFFVWDQQRLVAQSQQRGTCTAMAWSPDATRVAATFSTTLCIFSKDGELQSSGTDNYNYLTGVQWLDNGRLVTASMDGDLRKWGLDATPEPPFVQRLNLWAALSSRRDGRLAVADSRSLNIIDSQSGHTLATMLDNDGTPATLSAGGKLMAGEPPNDEQFRVMIQGATGSLQLVKYSEFLRRIERFGRGQPPLPKEDLFRPEKIGQLSDPAILEASALVSSRQHEGVLWTVSDSDNPAHLYALDSKGTVLASYVVAGAENHDWETIALDANGNLYIGDVGGHQSRMERHIYQVREPDPQAARSQEVQPLPLARRLSFAVPAAELDFEGSFVWDGTLYLVSKADGADTALYGLPLQAGDAPQLQKSSDVPNLDFITGAAISPDGRRLALISYAEIHTFPLAGDSPLNDLHRLRPRTLSYEAAEVEAVAWHGEDLLMLAEDGSLYRVDLSSRE